MRNNWIAKAGAAALVVSCAGFSAAQSNGPSGISARLGLFIPTDTSASDLSHTWLGIGVDYKLNMWQAPATGNGMMSYWGVSADYYSHGSNSNIPVVLNYNLRGGQLVYSLGVGVDFYNVPDLGSGSGTGLDLQAGVSYDLSTGSVPVFLQAKYFLASRSELRGFGLFVGVRF